MQTHPWYLQAWAKDKYQAQSLCMERKINQPLHAGPVAECENPAPGILAFNAGMRQPDALEIAENYMRAGWHTIGKLLAFVAIGKVCKPSMHSVP